MKIFTLLNKIEGRFEILEDSIVFQDDEPLNTYQQLIQIITECEERLEELNTARAEQEKALLTRLSES